MRRGTGFISVSAIHQTLVGGFVVLAVVHPVADQGGGDLEINRDFSMGNRVK